MIRVKDEGFKIFRILLSFELFEILKTLFWILSWGKEGREGGGGLT
jgi:hypothetical protein